MAFELFSHIKLILTTEIKKRKISGKKRRGEKREEEKGEDVGGVGRGESRSEQIALGGSVFNLEREGCPLRCMRHASSIFLVYAPGKASRALCVLPGNHERVK